MIANPWILDMWFNGTDYVIAESEKEASEILSLNFGTVGPWTWKKLAFDEEVEIIGQYGEKTTNSVLKWIIFCGKGWFITK